MPWKTCYGFSLEVPRWVPTTHVFLKKEEKYIILDWKNILPRTMPIEIISWSISMKSMWPSLIQTCDPWIPKIMPCEKRTRITHAKKAQITFHIYAVRSGSSQSIYADLIVLGFNDTSTLEGHFVSSPREREKRDRRESRGDEREGQGRKRNRKESEETEEIKTFPLYPFPLQG